jgi:hypothetical protein
MSFVLRRRICRRRRPAGVAGAALSRLFVAAESGPNAVP